MFSHTAVIPGVAHIVVGDGLSNHAVKGSFL